MEKLFLVPENVEMKRSTFICTFSNLPESFENSSCISSLLFDLGMLPTKSRKFGTLILIFKHFPGLIS